MREIKFRAFNTESQRMFSFEDLVDFWNFQDVDWINKGRSKSVLMQFTGLKDKKGIDIYEGDILDSVGHVIFKNGCFITSKGSVLFLSHYHREVIGNIHLNPELL